MLSTTALSYTIKRLDISEHCQSGDSSQPRCVYDLFAVIHHFGTINSGHCKFQSNVEMTYTVATIT